MHDVVGVGIGPFNLGLAALLSPLDDVDAVFFDRRPAFDWHPGLMVPDAEVQVPFLADLVTLADPTSAYSFLNYLHRRGRLYRFYFREDMHPLRREFEAYCRWVAESLPACRFGMDVESVGRDGDGCWTVTTRDARGRAATHRARHVVLGVGTAPWVPDCAHHLLGPDVLHSAAYMEQRSRLHACGAVAVIGAGQSAAEVVADLLDAEGRPAVSWYTRGAGFLPMEYSKLGLEFFSPEYVDHFHGLAPARRDAVRAGQDLLYKGMSAATSARIFDRLYALSVDGDADHVDYRGRCDLRRITHDPAGGLVLALRNLDDDGDFTRRVDAVVLATGYREAPWPALDRADRVACDDAGRPLVERDYRARMADGGPPTLFVQNAELHTHGVGTPDLGLAAYRNSVIANAVAGREVYAVRERNVFQRFGTPR